MAKKEETVATLTEMIGAGERLEIKGNEYWVLPILGAHIEQFISDNLVLNHHQIFNFANDEAKKNLNKWLGGEEVVTLLQGGKDIRGTYFFDSEHKPMSLDRTFEDGWDVNDYRIFLEKLSGVSG